MTKANSYLSMLMSFILLALSLAVTYSNSTHVISQQEKEAVPDTLGLDLESSVIYWKGTDMGGSHEGTIRFREGRIITAGEEIKGGYFEVDMYSIEVTDIPAHEVEARHHLTEHLESEDFFLVEKFPASSFEISGTENLQNDSLRITGDLSIRDVTKSISITAKRLPNENNGLSFEAFFVIDRFEWNVAYQGSFWKRISSIIDNNLVHDEIQLRASLHFYSSENRRSL